MMKPLNINIRDNIWVIEMGHCSSDVKYSTSKMGVRNSPQGRNVAKIRNGLRF